MKAAVSKKKKQGHLLSIKTHVKSVPQFLRESDGNKNHRSAHVTDRTFCPRGRAGVKIHGAGRSGANKLPKLKRHVSRVHFASNSFGPIHFVLEHFRLFTLGLEHVSCHIGHLVHLHIQLHVGHSLNLEIQCCFSNQIYTLPPNK